MGRGTATAALLLLVGASWSARAVLPPRAGGRLTLPAPHPVRELDPARARTHFEAALADAVFDGLYEIHDGEVVPVLAAGPVELEGTTATVRLRPGVVRHGGRPIRARQVVRSLARAASSPTGAWLLGAFATDNGRPAIREVDDATIELELARRGVRAEVVLAAAPLAVIVGGNPRRRPLGTGPYQARLDGRGGVQLQIFRRAVDGAPWIDRVRLAPATARDEEIRAFELGRLDGSWEGRSLYGGQPARPIATRAETAPVPVLLVPNRARRLRDDDAWGAVVGSIDRARLARAGLAPGLRLADGLPEPRLPGPGRRRARPGLPLRMPVAAARPRQVQLAEALAGMLDERGMQLTVTRMSDAAYEEAIARGDWDLRLAVVRPPLPGLGPLAGAALAAAGQLDQARRLAPTLGHRRVAAEVARDLGAMVLGHERLVLHHRADLLGVRFDFLGRLALPELSFARPVVEAP